MKISLLVLLTVQGRKSIAEKKNHGQRVAFKNENFHFFSHLFQEWQSFIESSGEHGIVILALGTLINDELTEEQSENIATSLSLLPQKVAWSYGGKLPKTLGNNTKVVKWLPQNDLLGKIL